MSFPPFHTTRQGAQGARAEPLDKWLSARGLSMFIYKGAVYTWQRLAHISSQKAVGSGGWDPQNGSLSRSRWGQGLSTSEFESKSATCVALGSHRAALSSRVKGARATPTPWVCGETEHYRNHHVPGGTAYPELMQPPPAGEALVPALRRGL